MYVIIKFACVENSVRHKDRTMVDLQITKWNDRIRKQIACHVSIYHTFSIVQFICFDERKP